MRPISILSLAWLALAGWLGAAPVASAQTRDVDVVIADGHYRPSRIVVRAGERARLRVVRHEDAACTAELVIASLGVRVALPPHRAVFVELPALAPGEHEITCGMGMHQATLVVEAS